MPRADPIVSVIVANRNGEKYLADALSSALNQTLRDIEIILIDDASEDASLELARTFSCQDDRVRVLARTSRSGPGRSRNDGLVVAKGKWIAVLDSDDMMHPARLEDLVREAETTGADLCADDLLIFQEGAPPATLLSERQRKYHWISASAFIADNRLFSRTPALGYLKPLIRTAFLRQHNISYNPDLMIGEDYDFVVQLLARGAKFRLTDKLGYFYRKHHHSISHRMSGESIEHMLSADARLSTLFRKDATDVARAFAARRTSIERAAAFSAIVAALKAGRPSEACGLALRNPRALPLLAMPVVTRLRKVLSFKSGSAAKCQGKQICLISRQRLIGNTNGSSTYVVALTTALRGAGHKITLISPSVATFGRWPFLLLRPEMDVFDAIHIRGAWRIGARLRIAKDPRIALAAASAIASRWARRVGLRIPSWDQPAPYAIAAPWRREDQLFIARHAPPGTQIVLADYAFTTPAIPYALAPSAPSAVIMHDFFSERAKRFQDQRLSDSVARLDQACELKLLRQADAIIAIQRQEAAEVARLLPDRRVIVAPLACRVVDRPQPGDPRTLLFVGSNTAPNVIGMKWFLQFVWPTIRRELPDCRLRVAGSVASGFLDAAPGAGVSFLGMVADLDPLYAEAGVVISPLTVGSGLKIKLIEALGQGKAIVATSVTTEGCEDAVIEAICQRDDAGAFADAVVQLLTDGALRLVKATQALDVARHLYAPEATYGELLAFAGAAENRDRLPEAPCKFLEAETRDD
ncbi:MAG: glycosyltransferase [Hyphomicrobiaceae bacterium]